MSTNPEFLFDFGSPNAYLSHQAIPAIEKRTGVRFDYVPVLLGGIFKSTNNKSPAETLAGVKNKPEFMKLETERFIKRFDVQPYVWNPFFPVNTLNLMRAAIAVAIGAAGLLDELAQRDRGAAGLSGEPFPMPWQQRHLARDHAELRPAAAARLVRCCFSRHRGRDRGEPRQHLGIAAAQVEVDRPARAVAEDRDRAGGRSRRTLDRERNFRNGP